MFISTLKIKKILKPKSIVTYLCLLLSFFYCGAVSAQNKFLLETKDLSQIHVEDLSIQDINMLYMQAETNGIDEERLYQLLVQRGLSEIEVEKLKQLRKSGVSNKDISALENSIKTTKEIEANKPNMTEVAYDKSIYGSELFSKTARFLSLIYELPLQMHM